MDEEAEEEGTIKDAGDRGIQAPEGMLVVLGLSFVSVFILIGFYLKLRPFISPIPVYKPV